MTELKGILWFFPLLFIFHDFEEIIFMKPWLNKNRESLTKRFPAIVSKLYGHFDRITAEAFALGVAEEYVIICAVTAAAFFTGWYGLWLGLMIAFTLHLLIHCVQAAVVRGYVPALLTSLVCLPPSIWILTKTVTLEPVWVIALCTAAGTLLMLTNLTAVHKGMEAFARWTEKGFKI